MTTNEKICIIFDVDQTLLDKDSDVKQFHLLPENEYKKFINEEYYSWEEHVNKFYRLMKKYGKTKEDVKNKIFEMCLSPKMEKFLNYLHNNKNKYELFILSAANSFIINCVLECHKLKDYFTFILCNNLNINSNNDLTFTEIGITKNCKLCYLRGCKSKIFKSYFTDEKLNKYSKIIFICDGKNDFCLACSLKINSYIFVRKNYRLDEMLKDEENNKKLKNKNIFKWENGDDLLSFIKNI